MKIEHNEFFQDFQIQSMIKSHYCTFENNQTNLYTNRYIRARTVTRYRHISYILGQFISMEHWRLENIAIYKNICPRRWIFKIHVRN